MSEGNERNLESVAPEAAENIQLNSESEQVTDAVNAASADEKMNAQPQRESGSKQGGKKKKKKSKKKNVVLPLVIVLVVVLVIFGILVGYGLGRVRDMRQAESDEEQSVNLNDLEDVQDYDAFTEELTQENQQALAALAGEDSYFSGDADALLGEDALLDDELFDGEGEQSTSEPVVVAEFGDGQTLMSDEVLDAYSEQLSMYILSGYSEGDVAETLLDDVLQSMVSERVMAEHAKEMGLDKLSDEDRAGIEAQAKGTFDEYVAYYREFEVDAAGMTDEEAKAAAEELLLEYEGVTYEGLLAETEEDWWEQKLYDAITADVTINDAQIQANYAERLEEQKESFTEFPEDYEFSQSNGEVIVYNLPGYRAVKVLMLGFADQETAMAVYGLADELAEMDGEADAAHQAELDGYYADPEARAKQALEKLRAGADMDEMILSIGADEGMANDRLRGMGYYVSSNSTLWPEEFVSAAMALQEVGDYSEPVRTEDGVCILRYLGDVPEGEVPLENVRDVLAEETLDAARYNVYAQQTEAWLEEANPRYYPERLQ